jgi:GntR family transcriptional regulator
VGYRVDPRSDVPPSRQIVEAVLDRLAAGALERGARLPSVRALAEEALVNPNTVGKAYRDLESMGVTEGRNGSGVFVTEEGPAIARDARRRETLAAFRRAAVAALRAGHDAGTLRESLDAVEERARAPRAKEAS